MRFVEAEPARCFDLLLSEEADLALLVVTSDSPALTDERFDQQPLLDDPLDLIVPQGHELTRRERVTLADAAGEPWILGNPGTSYHQLVLAACMSAGFTPQIAHHADEWGTGTALVAHGFGVILVRASRNWARRRWSRASRCTVSRRRPAASWPSPGWAPGRSPFSPTPSRPSPRPPPDCCRRGDAVAPPRGSATRSRPRSCW